MLRIFISVVISLAVPVLLTLFAGCKSTPEPVQNSHQIVALTGVKIIDGSGALPIDDAVMVIQDGRIVNIGKRSDVAIPESAKIVLLPNRVIMPGLISNHSHLGSVSGMVVSPQNYNRENILQQLDRYRSYGVTTVTALGVNTDLFYQIRDEVRGSEQAMTDILGADKGIAAEKGAPPLPGDFSGVAVSRAKNATEARDHVRQMKERGTDFIKLWYDDFLGTLPKMKPEIVRAIISESHKNKLRVSAHVYYLADAKELVQAKADILAHGIRHGDVDSSFIEMMKKNQVAYIPTLSVDESFYIYGDHPEWLQDPFFQRSLSPELRAQVENASKMKALVDNPVTDTRRQAVKTGQGNLKKLAEAGVLIGFGTDSGANPWRIPGFAEHRELELMQEAGLTPLQVIKMATVDAARIAGLDDRGLLAPGKRADFIILAKDPSLDILNTRSIESIWIRGVESLPQ